MKSALNIIIYISCFTFILAQVSGCITQKDTVASRGMQNLTARYNILYNARELLKESQQTIELSHQDNYDVLISVYKEPDETLSQPEVTKLDEVILKANAIINDKSQSKYVDDAYFVIAQANFYKSNFYNATEFFNYIYNSYPKQPELKQAALAYKARSLMNSERFTEAESTLDTAFKYLSSEDKSVADLYATKAQLAIYGKQDEEAVSDLEKAIEFSKKGQNRIRWTYLLAQLQQLTGKTELALENYTRVIKSNAPFDMAFNATLNHLSIRDEQSGRTVDKPKQLFSLLKDDNNLDFADQVYFKIANIYADQGELELAVENYNTSVRKSTRNENQKGLSYLALADLYFKQADYVRSKSYYDSTLTSLSPQYRDYEQIVKKANSLELLSNKLSIISREDTLQMLARLPEAERKARIGVLVRRQAEKAIQPDANFNTNQGSFGIRQPTLQNNGPEKFYFNNPIALSQGLSDFKRVWGNRKLEDNWRRSQRSSADVASASLNEAGFGIPANPDEAAITSPDLGVSLDASIPTTPELLDSSNHRILSAYYDIGNYYREVLNDEPEAIKTYETMLARFPDNNLKLPLYYNLYRLYAIKDPQKSLEYKNILLNQYADSPFAKIIRNPGYTAQTDEQETALHEFYNTVYENYTKRDYAEVLSLTNQAKQTFAENKLSPQLAYLNALALGHTQKLNVLDSAFKQIITDFPDEELIVPLVQQHLQFIDSNRVAMSNRTYALLDFDPTEPQFVEEPEAEGAIAAIENPTKAVNAVENANVSGAVIPEQKPVSTVLQPVENEKVSSSVIPGDRPVPTTLTPAPAETSIFTLNESPEYYFVVNVADPSVNLSSSRFGIGQFNRAKFSGDGIKHQLKSVNNQNQLIFVGVFSSMEAVAEYYRNISPLMKQIMKVPVEKYSTFYISKENLDRLTDREIINKYSEFYLQNFSRSE